jgi:quercetin dioxygenase-like cupin family protein
MQLTLFPFSITDFDSVEPEIKNGVTGTAEWRVTTRDDIRIRLVKYSPHYFADHWCSKGHIIYCIEGEMTTELQDGRKFILKKGQVYTVGDNSDAHRSYTEGGCTLFIVD